MQESAELVAMTTMALEQTVDLALRVTTSASRVLVNQWLRSKRSAHTQAAYARDISEFFALFAR